MMYYTTLNISIWPDILLPFSVYKERRLTSPL